MLTFFFQSRLSNLLYEKESANGSGYPGKTNREVWSSPVVMKVYDSEHEYTYTQIFLILYYYTRILNARVA